MKLEIKKQIILHLPYLAFVYLFGKVGQAFRLAQGADLSAKLLHIGQGFSAAFASAAPSFHPTDLLIGLAAAVIIRLVVYSKQKNAKKYRKGIEARVPSILVAGGSNFPVRKKEKQNAARDRNMQEWQDVQGILDKIRSTGMGGISMDDPQAAAKLEAKLVKLESAQEIMKAVNAYFRKNKTLEGCPSLTPEQITKLQQEMSQSWHLDKSRPYPAYMLSNNNAEIRRIRGRIEQVRQHEDTHFAGWEFDGGRVEANKADNRLQVFFDGKPDEAARDELKANGFRWAPSVGAWQRQLNKNAYYAAGYISCIQPISGEKPIDVQRSAQQQESAAPDAHLTGACVSTPRGSFHVTDMTREQMETAGYGYHHSTDDGKYLIMGNGTQAFAIAAEQREQGNYMRTAELSTEQNYNMIQLGQRVNECAA